MSWCHRCRYDVWPIYNLCTELISVDTTVRFYAIVTLGHRFRLVTLTPGISCDLFGSEGRERKALHTAFKAASVALACIIDDISEVIRNMPAEISSDALFFPSVSKLAKYGAPQGEFVSFQILERHYDLQSYRQLYIAERVDNKETVLLKFSRIYCLELHEFCLGRGLAPDILAFQELPGGWKAIAMEYIEEASMITVAPGLDTHRDRWRQQLRDLVDAFHGENLVHGDLRDANIICKGDNVKLIDFDWGGKDGEAKYPTFNLTGELLNGRKPDDAVITKADDDRILNVTLKKLDL